MNKNKILTLLLLVSFGVKAQEVKICTEDRFLNLDPHLSTSYPETQTFTGLVYEPVVKYNPRNKSIVPFLIERWTSFSNDKNYKLIFGKDISFTANKGEKSYKLDAEDFIFSFNLYLEKAKTGKIDDLYAKKNIQKVELSEDKKEVTIRLNKADPFFMMRLADKMGLVLSKRYHDELKRKNKLVEFYKEPMGTGAFGIKRLHPSELELEAKKNYHFGSLEISNIKFIKTPDRSSTVKYLQSGLCDIAPNSKVESEKLKEHVNASEVYISLKVNPRSNLAKITNEIPLWSFINFNSMARALNPEIKSVGQFVSEESGLAKASHIDMIYSASKGRESIKKMRLKQVTIFFTEDLKQEIKNMKSFLRYLKTSFQEVGLDITMGEARTADIVLEATHLNGMSEATLFEYYDFWPSEGGFSEAWFTGLEKKLGKEAHRYPLGFIDSYHTVDNKITRFYSHRSKNFDLTLLKKE